MSGGAALPQVSESERLATVRALARDGGAALDALLGLCEDPSWTVRREVVAALGALGPLAVPKLCLSLVSERHSETRIAATVDALVAAAADVESALHPLSKLDDPAVLADVAQILGRRQASASVDTLARLVEHGDDNVAAAAIEALGRVGGRRVVDVLVKAVESGRFFRAFAAIGVLGKSNDPRAIAPLVALVDNVNLGFEAIRALGGTGDRAAIHALCARLTATGDGVVRAAAVALAHLRREYGERFGTTLPVEETLRATIPNGALRRLIHCMNGADTAEQVAVVTILGCLRDEAATPALVLALDADPAVAAAAAEALKELGADKDPPLLETLRTGSSARREALLPIISRGHAVPAVLDCLRDPSPVVRRMACEALARIGNPSVVATLFEQLSDASPGVVQAAIASINALGSAQTSALATSAAKSSNAIARRAAFRILAYSGAPETFSTLEAGTRDDDARAREAAIQGLALVENPRAVELLSKLTKDPVAATRAQAVRALGAARAEPAVTQQLLDSLQDPDAWVRYYACQSLGKLGVAHAAEALSARLADVAGQVRVAAIEALSHLGGALAFDALRSATESDDVDQVRTALVGLGLSGITEAIRLLRKHTTSRDVATRMLAVSALANFDVPEALAVLSRASRDDDDGVRTMAIGFLANGESLEATLVLTDLLRHPATAQQALVALSVTSPQRVAGLSAALHAADDEQALRIAQLLARLNLPSATAALHEALTLANVAGRKAAATTLAAIGGEDALSALRRVARTDTDAEVKRICRVLLAQ